MENKFGQHIFEFSESFKACNLKLLLQSIALINTSNQFGGWLRPLGVSLC
jgi:hypothetical protein